MPAIMKASTGELRRSSANIAEKTAKYEAEYQKLYSEIASLRVEWQGQSSEMFNKQIESYRNDFQELATILRNYSEFLVQTASNIEKTEDSITASAGQLFTGK